MNSKYTLRKMKLAALIVATMFAGLTVSAQPANAYESEPPARVHVRAQKKLSPQRERYEAFKMWQADQQ